LRHVIAAQHSFLSELNTMNSSNRIIQAPEVNPETKAFWAACNAGVLSVGRCRNCAAAHYYPRSLCPFCLSADTVLEPVSGDARIYSCSVMRSAPEPYAIAFVTLAEGPTIMTSIVDCGFERIVIGAAVRAAFKPAEDGNLVPMFALRD
jgi:uncharacterized OB-fold protein